MTMKVVQINAVYGNGSTGTIVRNIQSLCVDKGIECFVAYGAGARKEDEHTYFIGNPVSGKFHALWSRIFGKQGYASWLPTKRLLSHLDRIRPDVVHLHNLHSNYINLPMLLRYLAERDIKTIVTLHDCWFYTGGCTHYTSKQCYEWKEKCENCRHRKSFSFGIFGNPEKVLQDRKRLFSAIPRLVVTGVSNWVTYEPFDTVFKGRQFVPIYNGINLDIFKPAKQFNNPKVWSFHKNLPKDVKIILAPANKWLLAINKPTLEYFISNLDENNLFLFFGSMGNMDTETVRRECSRLNDKVKVAFWHFTESQEELAELYSMADVMVNCTREETLSLINVECQACGTPVVTYDGTGVQETVDGKCGFAVASGDYEELFKVTQDVLTRGKQSELCREWAASKFEMRKNYAKYIELYNC